MDKEILTVGLDLLKKSMVSLEEVRYRCIHRKISWKPAGLLHPKAECDSECLEFREGKKALGIRELQSVVL